jgi:hypothetical protein
MAPDPAGWRQCGRRRLIIILTSRIDWPPAALTPGCCRRLIRPMTPAGVRQSPLAVTCGQSKFSCRCLFVERAPIQRAHSALSSSPFHAARHVLLTQCRNAAGIDNVALPALTYRSAASPAHRPTAGHFFAANRLALSTCVMNDLMAAEMRGTGAKDRPLPTRSCVLYAFYRLLISPRHLLIAFFSPPSAADKGAALFTGPVTSRCQTCD